MDQHLLYRYNISDSLSVDGSRAFGRIDINSRDNWKLKYSKNISCITVTHAIQ